MSQTVFVFSLENDCHLESKLFRVPRNCLLRLMIGPSLLGQPIVFLTDYPEDGKQFTREIYQKLPFQGENTALFAEIKINLTGSFRFFYHLQADENNICGSFFCVVDPELTVGHPDQEKILPLDSICCQTFLSKCLGHFTSWRSRLEVAKQTGYNMIHFTPIQELGASQSCYSLKDQLKLNPSFSLSSDLNLDKKQYNVNDVADLVEWMRREWQVLSITDIVLNHTANETPWLKEHPEATYNCFNSPHLRPAYLLDRILSKLTNDVIEGKWKDRGLNTKINCEEHLTVLRTILFQEYLEKSRIYEFFMVNVEEIMENLENKIIELIKLKESSQSNLDYQIKIIQDPEYRRLKSTINFAETLFCVQKSFELSDSNLSNILKFLREKVSFENEKIKSTIKNHLESAVENVIRAIRYERIQNDGPKIEELTKKNPLVRPYFTSFINDIDLATEEKNLHDCEKNKHFMAHNGWVMGDDPLKNFAEPGSNVYIRRELIVWSDSVKLRYGSKPSDSPFLWSYIEEYVTQMAKVFHGLRLDNCHSTPICLAQYMIDAARRTNPNLYLIAELFTSSEEVDNIFVNQLGINSLIREAMSASDPHDLGRQIYRFGGEPVGSFPPVPISLTSVARPLIPSVAHAIFFDMTHDNESPILRRSPYDLLSTSALVSMTSCAIGSTRGFDELVPHQIHVVKENRTYAFWSNEADDCQIESENCVSFYHGIIRAKKVFNELHINLCLKGYEQAFVDQIDSSTIAVTRHNRNTHESVVLVARTAFSFPSNPKMTGYIKPLRVAGKIDKILFETKMNGKVDEAFKMNSKYINGYQHLYSKLRTNILPENSNLIIINKCHNDNEIIFKKFPPSAVIAFHVSLGNEHLKAMTQMKKFTSQLDGGELAKIVAELSLTDINYVMFRCDQEERDEGWGGGAYGLPDIGALNYCGIAGIMSHLRNVRTYNDLGHPLCRNLREGDWLLDYIINRLSKSDSQPITVLSQWLSLAFNHLRRFPRYLIPRYFDSIITPLYSLLLDQIWFHSSDFVKNGSKIIQLLSLGGVALFGCVKSASLPPLAPEVASKNVRVESTLAAGLPHFAKGYMRCWGRDTFISLKGLLLITGRYEDAKRTILGFASTLRHGLIPNLLDGGINARYNCRDAVWWWIQSVKEYCSFVPNGISILDEPVKRIYPNDDSLALIENAPEQTLLETIQESLDKHFCGINFVERNAGTKIDAHMKKEGFNVVAGIDRQTGFVFGGNEWNCGTWMDKMGSSERANIKGKPSSPRDGSVVELIGLSKSVISWIASLHSQNLWPFAGVRNASESWTWQEWNDKIQANFEAMFYISKDSKEALINRKEIYKDSVGATHSWQDFQLRPNFLISMVVAPELFDVVHARKALELVEKSLVGPLGIKTLDPSDWNYRGDYDNSNDSSDPHVAHGFNYHQGPEWIWLMGYYLQAVLIFAEDRKKAVQMILSKLSFHFQHLESSHWYGLPELTNSNGQKCHDSCAIQSWSHATLLEILYSLEKN